MEKNVTSDIFRILIATDNHLGYKEKDSERGNDSFNTFDEILELAVKHNVDFVLLGGDLFHENKPSRQTYLRCLELLRKYTFGDRAVAFDFVSDPVVNFPHLKSPVVNYLDENLNVSIPVFSIHGNHDDPSGLGQLSPLDLLSSAGLINYFGRTTDLTEVNISPLLFEKGQTKLALYGLSSIKDERLFRLFRENKVKMLRPKESTEEWFNILVLHQNHAKHGMTNYIPEQFLDNFLDLVIWGHEHESLINPRRGDNSDGFFVVQPGSSVATSLSPGEAVEKHVAILEVTHSRNMRITPLKLDTVRPFIFEDISLEDEKLNVVRGEQQVRIIEEYIDNYIKELLEKAKSQLTGHPRQPLKPLIRLRIEYLYETQQFNTCRFGHRFSELVANPDDMILFKKKKLETKKGLGDDFDEGAMDGLFSNAAPSVRVEDLVEQYFDEIDDDDKQLQLLSNRGLVKAVSKFIEKDDKDAIEVIYSHQCGKVKKYLENIEFTEDDIYEHLYAYKMMRLKEKTKDKEDLEVDEVFKSNTNLSKASHHSDLGMNIEDDDNDGFDSAKEPVRGRRIYRSSRGSRGRGAKDAVLELKMADSKSEATTSSSTSRGRGRGRGRGRATPKVNMEPSISSYFSSSYRKGRGAIYDDDNDD